MKLKFSIPEIDRPTRMEPELPVDVHRAEDFLTVDRIATNRVFALDPGKYFAVVRFPNGHESVQRFDVDPNQDAAALERDGYVPIELRNIAEDIRQNIAPPDPSPWESPLKLNFLHFNPFEDRLCVEEPDRAFSTRRSITGPNGDEWRYVAVSPRVPGVENSGNDVFLIAIPTPNNERITLTLELGAGGVPRPDFEMNRHAATFLYRYVAAGGTEAAVELSADAEEKALKLVQNKPLDPVSGALGLYLLLMTDRESGNEEPVRNLYEYNLNIADGAVLLAEYCARQDDHEQARAILKSIPARGLPVLSIGFRVALTRTSTYLHQFPKDDELRHVDRVLRHWARRLVAGSPTTVIRLPDKWGEKVRGKLMK